MKCRLARTESFITLHTGFPTVHTAEQDPLLAFFKHTQRFRRENSAENSTPNLDMSFAFIGLLLSFFSVQIRVENIDC